MTGPDALLRLLASNAIGRAMPARLIRGGRFLDLEVVPAERDGAHGGRGVRTLAEEFTASC